MPAEEAAGRRSTVTVGDIAHVRVETSVEIVLTVLVAELDVAEEAADCFAHAASHRNRHPLQGQDRGLRPHPTPPFFKLASTTSSREIAARAASSSSRRERVTPPGMVACWRLGARAPES